MMNNDIATMTIRPATPEDAVFLGRCVCEGIGFEIFEGENEFNTKIATALAPLAAREDTLYSYRHALMAEMDGEVIGALISYPGERYHQMRKISFSDLPHLRELDLDAMPDEANADEFYLDTLAVLPQYRRRGVGTSLMQERIAWAKQNFPELKISLLVDPENFNGQRIYSRLGFVVTDRNVIAFNHLYWKMILGGLK